MNISIIIVTWNSADYIEGCLLALGKDYEIIVVDNHSQDNTINKIKKFPYVKLIENPYNYGLSYAINQATKIAKGKYIVILNPDVIVMENTIEKLYEFMEKNNDVGSCGARLFYPNGKIQYSCRKLPTFKNLFIGWKIKDLNYYNETKETEQPMGSCLIIRKEIFDKIGGMDERFPMYMNDVQLCYKIKELGYKIYFLANANAIHYLGASTKKAKRRMIIELHRSIYKYLKLHTRNYFLLLLFGGLLLAIAFYRILFLFLKRQSIR